MRLGSRIDRDEAESLARRACERQGLRWEPPIEALWKLRGYEFWTKSGSIGGNVIVFVTRDGRVTHCDVIPK